MAVSLALLPLVLLTLACGGAVAERSTPPACDLDPPQFETELDRRPFAMGFNRWPPDATEQAVERMNSFLVEHADLTLIHLDNGVPWPEALAGEPFSEHLQSDWAGHHQAVPPDHELLVAITPLNMERDGLAKVHGRNDNMDLPGEWRGRRLDHPEVIEAYANYARQVAEYFDPDHLAIGIEVNLALLKDPDLWQQYVTLHKVTYEALRAEHPHLPIFATFTLPHLRGEQDEADPEEQQAGVAELLPWSDYVGLSVYPYSWAYDSNGAPPQDYFDLVLAYGKPIAIAESGMPSQSFTAFFIPYEFEVEHQTNYMEFMLRHASEHEFVFVVNWAPIDFERLLDHFPLGLRDLGKFWAWTGLETADGCPKPALAIWDAYLRLPKLDP